MELGAFRQHEGRFIDIAREQGFQTHSRYCNGRVI